MTKGSKIRLDTEKELQESLLFDILSSGKNKKTFKEISKKLGLFLKENSNGLQPLEWIDQLTSVKSSLGIDYLYEFLTGYGLPADEKTLERLKEVSHRKNKLEDNKSAYERQK